MQFKINKKRVVLHGIKEGNLKEVKTTKMDKLQEDHAQISMIYVHQAESSEEVEVCSLDVQDQHLCAELQQLLESYDGIFAEPTTLPPLRGQHDHMIPLMEGSNPVNQRPYRYALYQKNEKDKMDLSLLEAGTIQTSSISYASPVVLVKKKDGTWRLCVDYRNLNGMTVKDRFSIPLIEDLMDELGGSQIYSKIDLRAGYHQVRMDPNDIHKTAFKIHSGHYEYLVMPFGLQMRLQLFNI